MWLPSDPHSRGSSSAGVAVHWSRPMSESSDRQPGAAQRTDASWLGREAVLDRFEDAWRDSGEADVAAFLPPEGAAGRLPLLIELTMIDLEYRWDRGQKPRVE